MIFDMRFRSSRFGVDEDPGVPATDGRRLRRSRRGTPASPGRIRSCCHSG